MSEVLAANAVCENAPATDVAACDSMQLSAWWLHPGTLFMTVVGGTLLAALAMPASGFAMYGMTKFLDAEAVKLAMIAFMAVSSGVYLGIGRGGRPRRLSATARRALVPWFYLAVALTVFGYTAWLASGVRKGFNSTALFEMLITDSPEVAAEFKFDIFTTIPGVTTCTQFGLIAVILGIVLRPRDCRWRLPLVGLVFLLAVGRMIIFSERLGLIEIAVPFGVVWLRTRVLNRPGTAATQMSLTLAPLVAVVTLILLFGTAEYFRSWQYYRQEMDSIVEFTISRLSGYYSTSHNNGALAWRMQEEIPMPLPYHTLEWFWTFPMMSRTPFSYEKLTGVAPYDTYMRFLARYANPEFNNPGGLFCPTLDYGLVGGALFWLAFGYIAGRLYAGFLGGSLAGLLLYPFIVTSILEVPRLLYICSVRPFAPLAFAVLIIIVFHAREPSEDLGVVDGH